MICEKAKITCQNLVSEVSTYVNANEKLINYVSIELTEQVHTQSTVCSVANMPLGR